MIIRTAQKSDLASIVEIYNQVVPLHRYTADMEKIEVNKREKWFDEHTPDENPLLVSEKDLKINGWISLSPYRPGRKAFRYVREVSYYVHQDSRKQGIASQLLQYVLNLCPDLKVYNLIAYLLEHNQASIALMRKFGFEQWGFFPDLADFEGKKQAHLIYGKHLR